MVNGQLVIDTIRKSLGFSNRGKIFGSKWRISHCSPFTLKHLAGNCASIRYLATVGPVHPFCSDSDVTFSSRGEGNATDRLMYPVFSSKRPRKRLFNSPLNNFPGYNQTLSSSYEQSPE